MTEKKCVYEPCCRYEDGVDCGEQDHCQFCGWNPFVALYRMVTKYGPGSENALSVFNKKVKSQ